MLLRLGQNVVFSLPSAPSKMKLLVGGTAASVRWVSACGHMTPVTESEEEKEGQRILLAWLLPVGSVWWPQDQELGLCLPTPGKFPPPVQSVQGQVSAALVGLSLHSETLAQTLTSVLVYSCVNEFVEGRKWGTCGVSPLSPTSAKRGKSSEP